MVRDISYCWYDKCPFTTCERHLAQLQHIKGTKIYSASDFHLNCHAYNIYVKNGFDEGLAAAMRGETGEWREKV